MAMEIQEIKLEKADREAYVQDFWSLQIELQELKNEFTAQ